jgi:hypothetical protein
MSNLENLIKYAREKKATAFKDTFTAEISDRVSAKFDSMKQSIAKTMFAKADK